MNGNITITRIGPIVKITNKPGNSAKSGKNKTAKGADPVRKKSGKRQKAASPSRAISRSINDFCQRVRATRNGPRFHISVNIPRVHAKFELPSLEYSLGEFFQEVSLRYPKAYFYRLYDFSVEAGLHAHIVARLYADKKRQALESELREIWLTIVGANKPNLLKVERYTDATLGYLTSPEKYNDRLIVRDIIGGKRMWAIINPEAVKMYKEQPYTLTPTEYKEFRKILTELILDAGLPESNLRQLEKINTCFDYLPEEITARAFNRFEKWRQRHES